MSKTNYIATDSGERQKSFGIWGIRGTTPWHCQTTGFYLYTISQMQMNVLDLPLPTCLGVCVCLYFKHSLHSSQWLSAAFVLFFISILLPCFHYWELDKQSVCQWLASALCAGGTCITLELNWIPQLRVTPVKSSCQSFVLLCQVPPCFHSLRLPVWTCSLIFHTVHRNIMLPRYWLQFTHR